MKPAPFRYLRPGSLDEALLALHETAADEGRVLAGGQSLVPAMAFRLARPRHLVDINFVAGLDRLGAENGELRIGARVRHAAFHACVVAGPLGRLLSEVVRHVAHYPIRMRGTFCGSLAHADPASEWCLVAATLGARIEARRVGGTRVLAASELFSGVMTTVLEPDEILTETRLPLLADDTRFGFYEFARRVGDYALAMALVTFRSEGELIVEPRIGIGGAEAAPRRLTEAESVIDGKVPGPALFRAAADAAAAAIEPLVDAQTDAAYRRDLVRAVTARALQRAAA